MSLEQISQSIAEYISQRDYHAAANTIVEARTEYFTDREGNPDYAGRSYAYRQWYAETINSLGLSDDERTKLLGRLRFHVGNALRATVKAQDLEDAGLLTVSPVQRGQMNYKGRSRPHQLFNSRTRLYEEDDIRELSEFLMKTAERLDIPKMARDSRSQLRNAVDALSSAINSR